MKLDAKWDRLCFDETRRLTSEEMEQAKRLLIRRLDAIDKLEAQCRGLRKALLRNALGKGK